MTTILFVHAHPDDEGSATAGSMALASERGDRVLTVFCTGGEHGESPDDLAEGETLADRRHDEAERAADILGVGSVIWLPYEDSGMTGWEQNAGERAFAGADVDEAARIVASLIDEEEVDVVVGYDDHGNYGHPDHLQTHRVTKRAVELATREVRYLESSMNRDRVRRMFQEAVAAGAVPSDMAWDPDAPADDGNPVGTPEAELHWAVEIPPAALALKREALACHASQTGDVGMMMSIPPEFFAALFGVEHYLEPGRPAGMVVGWPFDPAAPGATSGS